MGDRDVYAEAGEVSCKEAREIADRYHRSHFRERTPGDQARYSIPVDPRRDDDVRLEAFIRRAEAAFRDLDLLERARAHPNPAHGGRAPPGCSERRLVATPEDRRAVLEALYLSEWGKTSSGKDWVQHGGSSLFGDETGDRLAGAIAFARLSVHVAVGPEAVDEALSDQDRLCESCWCKEGGRG